VTEPVPPAESAPIPARLGQFEITGVLGEGGSATVYAARHAGEDVALKVPKDRELAPKEQERFLEEAKMLERVRHRAVIQVLDSGRLPNGQPFILMRRYEGETLADRIRRAGRLGMTHAVDLFEQLGSATSALHAAGLVHRDLKPENVLLLDEGRSLKLLDFGIAKDVSAPASTTTQLGIARGTPATMAPERFFGAPASESTDIYELGVVLYTMLVGRLPWPEVTDPNARLNPVSPADAGVELPEALATALMKALSTRPERRPENVLSFVDSIKLAARSNSPSVPPRVTAETSVLPATLLTPQMSEEAQVIESRRPTRSLAPWFLSAGLFLALAVGLGILVVFGRTNVPEPPPAAAAAAAAAPAPPPPTSGEPSSALVAPSPEPTTTQKTDSPAAATARVPGRRATPTEAPSGTPPAPSAPKPAGKPRGAPCTRSSECASMVCAAETCQ
jgi:serine/threonine protein kinase